MLMVNAIGIPQAQRALAYLDDQLKTVYEIRDMVDTTLSPAKVFSVQPNTTLTCRFLTVSSASLTGRDLIHLPFEGFVGWH